VLLINTEVLSYGRRSTFVNGVSAFLGLDNFCDFCPGEHHVLRCLRNMKASCTKNTYSQGTEFL